MPSSPTISRALFARWRCDSDKPFVLDMPRFHRAPILVTGANFGCGSAREIAVWRLPPMACVASSPANFSEIYRESLIKNGMSPVVLAPADRLAFEQQVLAVDGQSPFEIDLHRPDDRLVRTALRSPSRSKRASARPCSKASTMSP